MKNLGIDKSFLNDMYNKYGHYISRIPGLEKNTFETTFDKLHGVLDNAPKKPSHNIDFSKYPKL